MSTMSMAAQQMATWPRQRLMDYKVQLENVIADGEADSIEELELGAIGEVLAMAPIKTDDGQIVRKGDRVYNFYDCEWGVIASAPNTEGWFDFKSEKFGNRKVLNGARISTYQPGWAK